MPHSSVMNSRAHTGAHGRDVKVLTNRSSPVSSTSRCTGPASFTTSQPDNPVSRASTPWATAYGP